MKPRSKVTLSRASVAAIAASCTGSLLAKGDESRRVDDALASPLRYKEVVAQFQSGARGYRRSVAAPSGGEGRGRCGARTAGGSPFDRLGANGVCKWNPDHFPRAGPE